MNITSKLQKLHIFIVTHEYATGPSHSLEYFLKGRTASLAFIAHPFVFSKEKRSHMRTYTNGVARTSEVFFPWYSQIQFINLIKDILLTFWWCATNGPVDLYIGVDAFNAGVGVILQKFGWVKRTVFYTIDYIPNRFGNPLLNGVYHSLDAFAVKNVDRVWNLSAIMAEERAKKGLTDAQLLKKQIIVPVGTDSTVAQLPFSKVGRFHVAHMGHLTYKQGVQTIIRAIPFIIKRIPKFRLNVIGGGPMENELKTLARRLRVTRYVTFYGFIPDHEVVERLLSKNALAIAPYVDRPDNFVRYTDPGKVKAYLAVGLPIIITKVPAVWKALVKKNAGVAAEDTPQAMAEATVSLLRNEKKLRVMRNCSVKLGRQYTWSRIFTVALSHTL